MNATKIRPFRSEEDYPGVAAIELANYGEEYATPADEKRFEDEHNDPRCRFGRSVAEEAGHIVAFVEYYQSSGHYHPRKFEMGVDVHPDFRRCGIGSALFAHLLSALAPFDPLQLRTAVREGNEAGIRFLQNRDFVEDRRTWPSELDLAAFDPAPYGDAEARPREIGVTIKTYAELEGDADRHRKLFALRTAVNRDIPSTDPATQEDFDNWVETRIKGPGFLPDAYFVAVTPDGEYVGFQQLWHHKEDGLERVGTGVTGVLRPYRRKGIALAIKLRGIAWATARGFRKIRTFNDSTNRPMLSINERLGFDRQPAWIFFTRTLAQETS